MKKNIEKKERLSVSEITSNKELQGLLKMQQDFLINNFGEKDRLIAENKRLNDEIARLNRTIMLDNNYINYLLNTSWWKLTLPLRIISRKIKSKRDNKYEYLENLPLSLETVSIEDSVTVVIFTYNAGEEFSCQLDNIFKQKFIKNINVVIIDRGSKDNTIKIAKKYKAEVALVDDIDLTDDEMYVRSLPLITGKYVVIMDQNRIIDSKYWMYQAIRPIRDNQAISSVFFREEVNNISGTDYYYDLKKRMNKIAGVPVFFFPKNRELIQYFSPILLDKSCVLVKKNIANMFLI